MTQTYTLLAIAIPILYIGVRALMVHDFRRGWRDAFKDNPEAQAFYEQNTPSFARMLFSFKRLKDSKWYAADIRAARYTEQLGPKERAALKKFAGMKNSGWKESSKLKK